MNKESHSQQPDRRRYPRFFVPDCEVYYSTPLLPAYLRKPKGDRRLLVNMSAGGMQFIADCYLPPGRKLSLLLSVPAFMGNMMFRGRVVWSKKIPDKKAYQTGVAFIRIESGTRAKLKSLRKDVAFRTGRK